MKTEPLGTLVKITKGKKYNESSDSDLRYIQIEDLRSDDNLKYCKRIPNQVLCSLKDILIAWDGANAGTIGFGLEGAIGSTIAKLQITKSDIDTNYLGKFLQSKFDYLRERCTGATIPHISKQVLTSIKIPLPQLAEQQRIAKILDAADSLRKKTQKIIDSYDELAKSIFLDMFGDPIRNSKKWESREFGSLVVNYDSQRIPVKQSDRDKRQKLFPYYGATGIVDYIDDYIFDGTYLLIAEDGKNLINRKKPIAWMVYEKFWVNNHAHIVKEKHQLNLRFLEYFLNNIDISNYVTGIDQFKLNQNNLNRIPILLPPIQVQNTFSKKIELIEKQKELAKQSLKESEDLFNSLLQKAFKGELSN